MRMAISVCRRDRDWAWKWMRRSSKKKRRNRRHISGRAEHSRTARLRIIEFPPPDPGFHLVPRIREMSAPKGREPIARGANPWRSVAPVGPGLSTDAFQGFAPLA